MIQLLHQDGHNRPLVICDYCGEHIRDAGIGMVAFLGEGKEGHYVPIAYLHKGNCDKSYKGGVKRQGGWQELSHFIVDVCHNTGLTRGKKIAEAFQSRQRLSDLSR